MGADDHKKVFSIAEVSSHNNVKDCWVIVNSKAYDVTNFLTDHPGGEEVLLAAAGKDASEEFEDAGHGSAARLMLDEFYVGEIHQSLSTMPSKITHTLARNQHRIEEGKSPDFITNLLRLLLVPVAVVLIVAVIGNHLYT